MRIAVIGPSKPDTFGNNIGHSLEKMGHTVTYAGAPRSTHRSRTLTRASDILQQAYPLLEDRAQKSIAERVLENECEIAIVTDSNTVPEVITTLRNNRVKTAMWFPDAVVNLGRARMLAAPYDCLFFKDMTIVERLRDTLNLPVRYLPQACNPSWHRPVGQPGSKRHIAVVGNTYLTRLLLLERLVKDGVPIAIYGAPIPRWAPQVSAAKHHTGKSVYREEKSRVFREAAGVLNNLHPGEMHGLNVRLFEATAAGAAVLCERRPALAEMYKPGHEVLDFRTYDELLEHIRRLLDEPALTAEIGDAASHRANKDHTYENRLTTMLEVL